MADENTESNERTQDPTPRRPEEALRRGDVVKSMEVNTWFAIAGGTLAMMIFAVPMASNLQTTFRGLLARSYQIPTDGPALTALAKTLALEVGAALGVPLLILCVAAFAGNILQHRIVFTTDLIMPKMSRISPLAGMGRLFSRQALANFAKGLAKLCVVGGVMAWVLWPERQKLGAIVTADPAMILPFLRTIALKLLGTVVAVLTVIAAADYFFQYGSSAKKCRRRRSRKNSARPKAIPPSSASFGSCAPPACASVSWRAQGLGGHHQPDPLRDRAALRARHERAGLRRQRRRPDRPQDPRDRGGASHSRDREPAARPRVARHRRDRPGDSAGTLPRGRRNHRLHYAPAPHGGAVPAAVIAPANRANWLAPAPGKGHGAFIRPRAQAGEGDRA
jgi:hypothetical protein